MTPREISIDLPHTRLAGQRWGDGEHIVLALHGWLQQKKAACGRLFYASSKLQHPATDVLRLAAQDAEPVGGQVVARGGCR